MLFPLEMRFKLLALAPQITVTDAGGELVCYVRQKLFKLRESVTVFADAEQTRPLLTIAADRVLDFSARYTFTDTTGTTLGVLQRQGARSLWKAHYEVLDREAPVYSIQEENPWTKVLDSLLGDIPILGLLTGYFFHPAYEVRRPDGTLVMRLVKQPAFLEGRFAIERHADPGAREEFRILMSLLMVVLLERNKG